VDARAEVGSAQPGDDASFNPFARTIDAAKEYVVSSTLDRVDWNVDLKLVSRLEFGSGAVAMRYEPRR